MEWAPVSDLSGVRRLMDSERSQCPSVSYPSLPPFTVTHIIQE